MKDYKIQCAELSFITIQQTSSKDAHVHFAQAFHKLQFSIRFRVSFEHVELIAEILFSYR